MLTAPAHTVSHGALLRADRTAMAVFVALTIALGVLVLRVAQLQIAPGDSLRQHMGERTSVLPEPGRRGDISDRRGRLIASSSFGQRIFVDPAEFPRKDTDKAIVALATALGVEPAAVAAKVLPRMLENERRVRTAESDPSQPARLLRFVALSPLLDDARLDAVEKLNIPGVHLENRAVRTTQGAALAGPIVGKVGFEGIGFLGAEKLLDKPMQPKAGQFSYVRDAAGRPLWIEPGGYTPPERGGDARLALDLELQRIVQEELTRAMAEFDAAGARCVLLDPATGEVLAMVDVARRVPGAVEYDWLRVIPKDNQLGGTRYVTIYPDPIREKIPTLGRNRCVEDIYEPGSTFKPFMWAAVTERSLAKPTEVFNTYNGAWTTPIGRSLHDVVKKDRQTWAEVLINSSNIGMVQGVSRLTFLQARDAVVKFGFGARAGSGLPYETAGLVTPIARWSKHTQTSIAYGHEIAVTPLQMARAFSVFARNGEGSGVLPPLRLLAADSEALPSGPVQAEKRVLPRQIADLVRQTLRGVTQNLDRKLAAKRNPESGWRYEIFGKSGTAEIPLGMPPKGKKRPKGSDGYFNGQYNSSFIAAGPYENPRLVCLVVIDDPGPAQVRAREHYGSATAGPVVRRVMERSLAYLGVPASPPPPPNLPRVAE